MIKITYDDGDCRYLDMDIYAKSLEVRLSGVDYVILQIGDTAIHLPDSRWIEYKGITYRVGHEDIHIRDEQ